MNLRITIGKALKLLTATLIIASTASAATVGVVEMPESMKKLR